MTPPNFSGQWRFDPEGSRLQINPPEIVEFAIEHRDPRFRLARTFVVEGRRDTFTIDLTVGADNPPLSRGSATIYPSLRWEGDELVFLTRVHTAKEGSTEGDEATNLVRYRLEKGGTLLVAEETFRGSSLEYDNHWVFFKDHEKGSFA